MQGKNFWHSRLAAVVSRSVTYSTWSEGTLHARLGGCRPNKASLLVLLK